MSQPNKKQILSPLTEDRVKEITIETLIELKLIPIPQRRKTITNE